MTVNTSEPLYAINLFADVGNPEAPSSDFVSADRLEGEAGDLASGSEKMRAPGEGCDNHDGV